jgi:hypothetical protein
VLLSSFLQAAKTATIKNAALINNKILCFIIFDLLFFNLDFEF